MGMKTNIFLGTKKQRILLIEIDFLSCSTIEQMSRIIPWLCFFDEHVFASTMSVMIIAYLSYRLENEFDG